MTNGNCVGTLLPSSPSSPLVIGLWNGLQGNRLGCGDRRLKFRGSGNGGSI